MALPTSATPGYGYYYTLGPTPNVACNCSRAFLDAFKNLLQRAGQGTIAVWQCTGDLDASGGVHSLGGAIDWGGISAFKARIAREMGLWAFPRPWAGNYHTHGALYGCPHNKLCVYQISAARFFRKDGTGYLGLGGPDPLPMPSQVRTWQEGITWSKSAAALTWINQHRATTTTAAPEDDMPYTPEQIRAMIQAEIEEYNTRFWAGENGTGTKLLKKIEDLPEDVWKVDIQRASGGTDAIQELANLTAAVKALGDRLASLEARP